MKFSISFGLTLLLLLCSTNIFSAPAVTSSYSNPQPLFIDDVLRGPAVPYPSSISVSGLTAAVSKVTVTIANLNHTFPDDLDILLVSPGGASVMLMSDAGTDFDAVGVTLTFDDNAAIAPPNSAQLVSGTFRPSNYLPDETLPLPAPPPPYGSALSAFNGTNPNGMWSLFVSDDTSEDGGSIDGGWSLTITTTEPIADLAVTQRASPNPTAVGTNVTLALTITNLGPAPASNVILTDALPAGLTFISVASSSGSCSNNAGLINCNWPNLPVGAGANVSILVQPALGGFFTNTVLGGGQELDVAPSNNAATTVISVSSVSDLGITLADSPSSVLQGQNFTSTIQVSNAGPNSASNVILADPLPPGVVFVSAVSSQGACSNPDGVVRCQFGALANGLSASVSLVLRSQTSGLATNIFSVSADQFDNFPGNNSAAVRISVDAVADLAIDAKFLSSQAPLGQLTTCLLTISNSGPGAAGAVLISNTFPTNLLLTSAVPTQGQCTNDGTTVLCDLDSLAPGESALITLSATASTVGFFTNSPAVSSGVRDLNLSNNVSSATIEILPVADLWVTQTVFPALAWLGESITCVVTVTNQGPSDAAGVVFTETPLPGVGLLSAVSSQGACSIDGGVLSCALGSLPAGGAAGITVVLLPSAQGDTSNQVFVSATTLDLIPGNNQSSITATVISPALTFSDTNAISFEGPGPALPYPSTIYVSGLTAAVQRVRVTLTDLTHLSPAALDCLLVAPDGHSVLLMSGVGGAESVSNVTLTLEDEAFLALPETGPLGSGTFKPADYPPFETLPDPAPPGPYSTALSSLESIDPNGPWSLYLFDHSQSSTGALAGGWSLTIAANTPIADLSITTFDLPEAIAVGSNVVFNINVSNAGPARVTQVFATDSLPQELLLNSITSSQGSCTNTGSDLLCSLGDLAPGSNALITVSILAANPAFFTNVVTVSAKASDPDLSNNVVITAFTAEIPPSILLDPQSLVITNGDSAVFTITATGAEPLLYQWQRNGIDLLNETNATFALGSASPLNFGDYRVRVFNRVASLLSATATLTVLGPPHIFDLPPQIIDEDTDTGPLPFTIGDSESPADTLQVTGSSSNPGLIPDGNIFITGSGSNRTVRLVPLLNQNGTAAISLHVSDPDGGVTVFTFLLTVRPLNDPPVLAPIADQVTLEDHPAIIPFTADDPETEPGNLLIGLISSNQGLVPNFNFLEFGTGPDRTLIITPLPDQFGTTELTLTVTDENGASVTTHFKLTVLPVNDPPTLAAIPDQIIDQDSGPQTIALSGIHCGPTNEFQHLRVSAISSQPGLIQNPLVSYVSPETSGSLVLSPLPHAHGTATITVTLNDGQPENSTFSQSFNVEIRPLNEPPSISAIPDRSTLEDVPLSLPLAVSDDAGADNLQLSGLCSDSNLVSATNITFRGAGLNRIVTIIPNTNRVGAATITLTATDTNGATASQSFTLTVLAVNDSPTLNPISDKIYPQNSGTQTVSLSGIAPGPSDETESVTVTAVSSNPALIPNPVVTYVNPASTASLAIRPAANATGAATITVTVNDGQAQNAAISRNFTVTVVASNSFPTISAINNATTPEDTAITIPFLIGDRETLPYLLGVSARSSNTNLIPAANLFLNGVNSNRTLTAIPAADQSGTSTLTLTVSDGVTNVSTSFIVTVAPVNDRPTIDPLPDMFLDDGNGQFTVNFGGITSGATNEAQTLSVTAVSSNTTLLTIQSVSYLSPATNGSLRLHRSSGTGTAVIALTVNDGGASNNIFTRTFTVYVKPIANTAPTISAITARTTAEDTSIGPIAFTIGDAQTAAAGLSLKGACSNPALLPSQNIVFGGSGSNRTVTITPASNQSGSGIVTLTVQDAQFGFATSSFPLAVTPVNDSPIFSNIPDQTAPEDGLVTAFFTVQDVETAPGNLSLSAHSSNPLLIPDANLRLGGSGTNRALLMIPRTNQNGTATITLTASDGAATTSQAFLLTVTGVNDPPGISAIPDQFTTENTSTSEIPFVVADLETAADALIVSAISSNPALVPNEAIIFGGSGANRTVSIAPALGQTGFANITLTVQDENAAATSISFLLNVALGNSPPTIDPIADYILNQHADPQVLTLTGISSGTNIENQFVTVTALSSDASLVPNPTVTYRAFDSTATLVFTPVHGVSGTATIVVTVDDGQGQNNIFTTTFHVTLTDAPVISGILDVETDEDTPTLPIPFNVRDLESPAGDLVVTGSSSNPLLLPENSFFFSGAGAERSLILLPATNGYGDALVTLTVADGEGNSSETSFWLTVHPVNNAPTISKIPDQSLAEDGTLAVSFTISDVETPASNLSLSAHSSNASLIPDANLHLDGTGTNRSLVISPLADQNGFTTVTISASDGSAATSTSFVVTVTAVNDPPVISSIPDQATDEDTRTAIIPFSISDLETPAAALVVTASSSDSLLLPQSSFFLAGEGTNRTLTLLPATNAYGNALITLTVEDSEGNSAQSIFSLTVHPVNDSPVLSNIPDQVTDEDTATATISFSIADLETPAEALVVTASSSDPLLLPQSSFFFGGEGTNRTVTLLPATNAYGNALITLTVVDPEGSFAQTRFRLTVNPVPDLPEILTQPLSQTLAEGNELVLSVVASGLGPLNYQWQRNGADLPGQTDARLILPSVHPQDSGSYQVVVNNVEGNVTSATALVQVVPAPPTLSIVLAGSIVRVSFPTVAGQTYTLEYKASLSDPSWTPLPSQSGTGDPLTIEDAQADVPARYYRLRVE